MKRFKFAVFFWFMLAGLAFATPPGTYVQGNKIVTVGGKAFKFPQYTVATLPTLTSGDAGATVRVTDGADAEDCTTGSGSTVVTCRWTGSAWTNAGDGQAAGSAEVQDATIGALGNGDTSHAYSKDDEHDYLAQHDDDFDGLPDGVEDGAITAAMLAATLDLSGKTITFGLEAADIPDISANYQTVLTNSAGLAAALSDETGTGAAVFANSPTLVTPALGTIASGVGTALTALNGENIQDGTIDDDSLDFTDITLNDFTFDVGSVDKTEFGYLDGVTSAIQTQLNGKQATVTEGSLTDSVIVGADIKDNTITSADLAAALTFAEGDLIDLSGITMSASTDEGLALPTYADVAPATEKYYLAYDAANNSLMVRESGGWVNASAGAGAATTLNFITTQAEGSLSSESVLTAGYGIDITDAGGDGGAITVALDTTEVSADGSDTWSDGTQAAIVWTFDVSGTDHTMTAGNGLMTFGDAVMVTDTLTASNGIALGASKSITGTTAMTIGGGSETVAINSSDWDIDATGVMTGMGNITSDGVVTATGFTIGSAAITETELEILDGATLSTTDINIIDGISDSGSLTAAELLYVDGVTSSIQTQLDARCLESVFGTALEADDLALNGTTLELVAEIPHIDAAQNISADWETQDNVAESIGSDNDWERVYDETTDDRLEYTHAAGPGADVYWDLNDNAAASTFTIANSDGTYAANLVVEGTISEGGALLSATYQPLHGYLTDISNISIPTLGDLMYFDGTDWVALAPGTNGYFLQSQGDGSALTWASGSTTGVNETYGSGWDADSTAPEKDDVYDWGHLFDTDDDGYVNVLDPVDASDEDATFYFVIMDGATGAQVVETDAGMTYNPSTNVLTFAAGGGIVITPNSTAAQYSDYYEDTDDGSNYHRIQGQAFASNRTSTLPDYNIGFLASTQVDSGGDLADGSVDPAHLADADFGIFTVSSGVAGLDANTVDSDAYVDGSIDPAHLADADFGAFSVASGVATNETITVTDNENTAEANAIVFVANADLDGATDAQLESDGDLTYNPSTGTLAATEFSGGGGSLTGVDAATGDSATAFFDAGTIEHERGGLEADVSAYAGLVAINGGSTSNITDAAGLETILSLGAYASDLLGYTSAAAVASGIGVGTEDSPQFTGIELGHASDTTITRLAAGQPGAEGKHILLGPTIANKTGNYTIGTDDSNECYGGKIYVAGAATITGCPAAQDVEFTVITYGAYAVSVDPDASGTEDTYILDGTALAQGAAITNTSTTGDTLYCAYQTTDTMFCWSGSPDGDHWTGP